MKKPNKKVTVAKGIKITRAKEKKMEKSPGSSNTGEYKKVKPKEFCGASGGSSKYSYPVNTSKRRKAAVKLAHYAPDPAGIKACVKRKSKKK